MHLVGSYIFILSIIAIHKFSYLYGCAAKIQKENNGDSKFKIK